MSISGMLFLFLFLPLALAIYYIVHDKAKEYVLLAISLLFYAFGTIQYVILFSIAILVTILIGRGIHHCSIKFARILLLVVGIVLNAGLLIYYKYADFAIVSVGRFASVDVTTLNLLLPLGISFFTFKAISYLADIYKGTAELESNPIHDAVYLSFFAQIQSGPLTRYNDMKLTSERVFQKDLFADGVYRFLIGFSKKVLISNVLANVTSEIFGTPFYELSTAYAWLGSICYSLQLFFDFAGYSDMAIGISEMFGYHCMENFNYPYMTESVTKFWRRWHISLSEWFRDYIYIPLGGSKVKSKWRVYLNLLVVWALTGIWHGAAWNFIAWGLGYFVVIAFERLTNLPGRLRTKFGKIVYRILSLLFINFQWVLFNSDGLRNGLRYIRRMIICPTNQLMDYRALFLLKDYGFFIGVAILLCFPIIPYLDRKLQDKKLRMPYEIIKMLIVVGAFVWAISFVVSGQNNPFAYANF